MKGFGEKPPVGDILTAPWLAGPPAGLPGRGNPVPVVAGEEEDTGVLLGRPGELEGPGQGGPTTTALPTPTSSSPRD